MEKKKILIAAIEHLISYKSLIKIVKKHWILAIIVNGTEFDLVKYNLKEYYEKIT